MIANRERWYLDACVITRYLENHSDSDDIEKVMNQARIGAAQIIASTIMLVEVSRSPGKPIEPAKLAKITAFYQNDYLTLVDLHQLLAEASFKLIVDYSWLRPMDAVHLATAIDRNCTAFFTYDSDILGRFDGEHNLQVLRPGDPVRSDQDFSDYPMFADLGFEGEPV